MHFKGRQAVNKQLVLPREIKWMIEIGVAFISLVREGCVEKAILVGSEMAGAKP